MDKDLLQKLKDKKSVKILAIESSCDETSIAVVENGRKILSNIIASQIDIHTRFGGVVPEVASRNHITAISNVCKEALKEADLTLEDIDAIAVTYGAGLLGALLVGVSFAKGLSYMLNKPLIAVSHIKGHIAANYLTYEDLKPPFVCLLVSGGHTALLNVKDYTKMEMIGTTVDDAVGEAFDKVARVIGLGYPGGPKIDNLAKEGKDNISFTHHNIMGGSYNFSFSGIKTAVINYVHTREQKNEEYNKADVASSFQKAVVDELCQKTLKALKELGQDKLVVAGGVGANSKLKEVLSKKCQEIGVKYYSPSLKLCTDNAAMIGSYAYYQMLDGDQDVFADLDLSARSTLPLK